MGNLLIPRVFHRIWLGHRLMPPEFVEYGQSWLRHHPGWKMKLWTEKNMIPLTNQKIYNQAHSVVQKADIARYEILYRFGGVYIDCDFQSLRNIEPLLNEVSAFTASEAPGVLSIGIMGCIPGHPVFQELVEKLPESLNVNHNKSVVDQSGPGFFTAAAGNRSDIVVFGSALFYPYYWTERHRKGEFFPHAYAVHHWAGSWKQPVGFASSPEGYIPRNLRCRRGTRIVLPK